MIIGNLLIRIFVPNVLRIRISNPKINKIDSLKSNPLLFDVVSGYLFRK